MTIYTADTQLGTVASSGIFTADTRFGADGDATTHSPQIITPSWKRSCAAVYFGATCVITQTGDLSWRVQADVGGGWFRGYIIFLGTVNSGSYGAGHVDGEITCTSGDDPAELVGMHAGTTCNAGDTPILSDGTTPNSGLAIGASAWFLGAGGHTYQTGYFGVIISGNSGTGSTVDAYFKLSKVRWSTGSVLLWDEDIKGIQTSNVKYG